MTVTNPFDVFRAEFLKDTGLESRNKPTEYIAYVSARLQQASNAHLHNINDTLKQLVEATRANKPK